MRTKTQKSLQWMTVILMGAALIIGSCASAAMPTQGADYTKSFEPAPAAPMPESEERMVSGDFQSFDNSTDQQIERLVIKNADLSIVVNDPSKSMDAIAKMADDMGGFVVSANMYKQELASGVQVPRASITIRVPSERLNEALSGIKAESEQVPINESINSQDVTSDYVDLQSRLKNLEAAEAQLAEIMENANKTEDVLNVYSQLVQVREQIEVIKGQIKYYEESAALSSVSVDLLADEAVQPLTIGGWQPVGVAKNAIQTLIDTLKFLVNALIWILIYIIPVLLLIYLIFVLPLTLLLRFWRKRRQQRKAAAATQEASDQE